MGLRCRAGDLAIMVAGAHVGRMVTVVRFNGDVLGFVDTWVIEANVRLPVGSVEWIAQDSWMLPIRPDELKEETEKEVTA